MKAITAKSDEIRPVLTNKSNGQLYAYLYQNVWNKEKKRSVCKNRRIIGPVEEGNKVSFGKKFLSNHPQFKGCYGLYSKGVVTVVGNIGTIPEGKEAVAPQADAPKSAAPEEGIKTVSSKQAGASYILENIARSSGILRTLEEVFGQDRALKILSLAIYFTLFEYDAAVAYEDREGGTYFPAGPISSQRVSELFQEISFDETRLYMEKRINRTKDDTGVSYWAYDTTSISSFSELISLVAYGWNKEHDKLPQLNLGLITDSITGEPVYYQILEGSVSDAKAFRSMLAEMTFLDPKSIRLVIDRAFSSPGQLDRLYAIHLSFITGAKSSYAISKSALKWASPILLETPPEDFNEDLEIYCRSKEVIWHFTDAVSGVADKRPLYIHVYFDPYKRDGAIRGATLALKKLQKKSDEKLSREEYDFLTRITKESAGKRVKDEEKWQNFRREAGFFFLISDCVKDGSKALELYRRRDEIEKAYTNFKERCGGRRLRCGSEALEGKVFVLFIALTLRMLLGKAFRELPQQDRPCKSLEEFLRKAETINKITYSKDGQTWSSWTPIPKSVEVTMRALKIKIPHS